MRSMSVLGFGAEDHQTSPGVEILSALELLREMSRESLAVPLVEEVSAVDVVLRYVETDGSSTDVRVLASMAYYTIGCRNGLAVFESLEVVDRVYAANLAAWGSYKKSAGDSTAFDLLCALQSSHNIAGYEGCAKTPSASRAAIEAKMMTFARDMMGKLAKWTQEEVEMFMPAAHTALAQSDVVLACGAAFCVGAIGYLHPTAVVAGAGTGLFTAGWHLHRRVCPVIPRAEWWLSKAAVVDVDSLQMAPVWFLLTSVRRMTADRARSLEVWAPMLSDAIEMMKMNQMARLSSGDTMSCQLFCLPCILVEFAAQDESQRQMLLGNGALDALEYACVHDFACMGMSVANYAAEAVVELCGRNEEGKTLSRETVFAVLRKLEAWLDDNSYLSSASAATAAISVSRVATMAISDANKRIMLEFDSIVNLLVRYLLVGSPRRGEKGADAMQEAAAGLILMLALFEPSAKALRTERSGVLEGLRGVLADGSATEGAVQKANQALFQLDADQQSRSVTVGSVESNGVHIKHVMVSYCWAQQPVVKRIHAALVGRGYIVWIDVEQMKGSTVDAMALAVEGACVMLMGVSRQYKESTSCRLEAQYAMQREVETVPLMLAEGYRADGWLGFMVGTRLWYGFYGAVVLSKESQFEGKVSELCRELGDRGRAAVSAAALSDEPAAEVGGGDGDDLAIVELMVELRGLKARHLRKRAVAAGASEEAVDDAEDAEDEKAALIELIISGHRAMGESGRMVAVLEGGGEGAVALVESVLEHAMEVLEAVSSATPRKGRKALRGLLDRVESVLEGTVDVEWADGVSQCDREQLEVLGSALADMKALALMEGSSGAGDAAMTTILGALDCLARCGSVVLRSMAVLGCTVNHLQCGMETEAAVVDALETLRGMSQESLDVASVDEVLAVDAVLRQMEADESSSEVRVSANMACYTLGCRNGLTVCGSVDVADRVFVCNCAAWDSYKESAGSPSFEVLSAAHAASFLIMQECVPKTPSAMRAGLEARAAKYIRQMFGAIGKWTDEMARAMVTTAHEHGVLDRSDSSHACGVACSLFSVAYMHQSVVISAADMGMFVVGWRLHRRICPVIPSVEWWSSRSAVVDVDSAQMAQSWAWLSFMKLLPVSQMKSLEVWVPMLTDAIKMAKMNQVARLSSGDTMSLLTCYFPYQVIECAAKDETQHVTLLNAGVVDALEYACANDFVAMGMSNAAYAAGAVTELVGRNEEGKTLSRETVFAVLSRAGAWLDEQHWISQGPPAKALSHLSPRVLTMAISDANKRIMLEFDGIVEMLVKYMLIGSPRRGEKGGDAMQEAAAKLILTLALFEPMAKMMCAEGSGVVEGLRGVVADGSATKDAVRSAKQALFELETKRQQTGTVVPAGSRGAVAGKHVMVSYCWAQQPMIKRIHGALVERGYAVWIDVEQMKGSTVDAMALAVEGACVVLMGVSREYKESTNCRLEAQYAMQREVEVVPLMLSEGYRADGWLGFMIGTRMWYGFYGAVSSSESLFEGKVSELCRELGERGCGHKNVEAETDHVVATEREQKQLTVPAVSKVTSPNVQDNRVIFALQSELSELKLSALQKRAVSAGVDDDAVEDALDADDSKAALIALVLQHRRETGAMADVVQALESGGDDAVSVLGTCLDHAAEVLDSLLTSLGRRERKRVMELLDRVEGVSEGVIDVGWCAGLRQCSTSEMERLGTSVVGVTQLAVAGGADSSDASMAAVLELLVCVGRCGSAVLRSLAVLSCAIGEQSKETCVAALEALRLLPDDRQEAVSSDEVSAAIAILPHIVEGCPLGVRESANMALFTLGCRNGFAACTAEGVFDAMCSEFATGMKPAVDEAAASGRASVAALRVGGATGAVGGLLIDCVGKLPSSVRGPYESAAAREFRARLGASKGLSDGTVLSIFTSMMEGKVFDQADASLACGYMNVALCTAYTFPQLAPAIESMGVIDAMWDVWRLECVQPRTAEWWSATAAVVDVHAVYANLILPSMVVLIRELPGDTFIACAWWRPFLEQAISLIKVNHSARLSERDTMACYSIVYPLAIVSNAAQKSEAVHPTLLEPSVLDALEYASTHDFTLTGKSVAAEAAGALVSLLGRNEGGKTLSRATINSVMADLNTNLAFEGHRKVKSFSSILPVLKRVATMAISDANKMLMLESKGATETLLKGLLLSSPRRSEAGADAVQEECAALLLSLALCGAWAEELRGHTGAMCALRELRDGDAGTVASRRSGESALFELEGRVAMPASAEGARRGGAKQHVMMSYCWDQQEVIKRVHSALIKRGYSVWIDVEQMTGSTVDSMALAVENAIVMLIGVSRQYKESTNCRLEAQYAMQREVPTVPLMLSEGYQADGWLGMLVGVRMWYGFYGRVLSDESTFEGKMSELCRDLGARGRWSAPQAFSFETGPHAAAFESPHAEMSTMKMSALKSRALGLGVDAAAVDGVDNSDDPKQEIIALLLDVEASNDTSEALHAELLASNVAALKKRSREAGIAPSIVEDADDTDDPKQTLIRLLLGSAGSAGAVDALRAELAGMKVAALKKRLLAAGADVSTITAVDDTDDPKQTLIHLILKTRDDSLA